MMGNILINLVKIVMIVNIIVPHAKKMEVLVFNVTV